MHNQTPRPKRNAKAVTPNANEQQTSEQKPTIPGKKIPGMWDLIRISLLTANEYAATLLPVVQLGVALVIGVMRKGNKNEQQAASGDVGMRNVRDTLRDNPTLQGNAGD